MLLAAHHRPLSFLHTQMPAAQFFNPFATGHDLNRTLAGKVALITGITGQDGSYLAEFLLEKGYEVHGIIRRSSSFNTGRIEELYQDPHIDTRKLILHYGDLTDSTNCFEIVSQVRPDELYNLGAQSHVKVSFEMSE